MSNKKNRTLTGFEIAIIGMSGRFPGAENIEEFWDNLKNSRETITFFSDQELREAGVNPVEFEDPDYIKAYGVLDDLDYFDSSFFGYSPAEARQMDPQMRLFHEYTWTALEDAGYDPGTYSGLIGLFVGATDNFYWRQISQVSAAGGISSAFSWATLANKDYISTRISFKLNLKGPSSTIFNACSTSLIATHMACQSLLSGDCDMALAGGVAASVSQHIGYPYQEGMLYSSDGHTRTFDAEAKGTVFGEGIGIVVLKRFQEAIAHRDNIYAVIKGTAVNNDGNRKVGYTAPSVEGQADVIRAALQVAEVEPESIGFIEAHGTATTLGDPIEIEALKQAFNTDKRGFCPIGAVKSNVGHLDAAAGVTSLIKTILAIKHKLIPASLHFNSPNPEIDFENSPFYVNTSLLEWKNDTYPLRAGVSSFGIGGTNAHVVLEEWSHHSSNAWRTAHGEESKAQSAERQAQSAGREYQLIVLSARTQSALDKVTANLVECFKTNPGIDFTDVVYTLQVGRRGFSHRRAAVCSGVNEAAAALSFKDPERVQTAVAPGEKPSVVFMFPGQGSQYVNMGLELYHTEPVFRREMDRCFEILRPLMDCDIKEILYPGERKSQSAERKANHWLGELSSKDTLVKRRHAPGAVTNAIDQTEITQPVIFVLEYALATLLMHWGIKPQAMIGHSIGEYTAACLAGVFSLEDALKLVVVRGQLMQQMPTGAMLSVPLPEEELKPLLNEEEEVELAAVNTPSLCVVSGTRQAVDAFKQQLTSKGIDCRLLHTSHAFHSRSMDPILKAFENRVKETRRSDPGIHYLANLTGRWITPKEAADPGYWSRHLRRTVRFGDGLTQLLKQDNLILVEVGPGNVLSTFVRKHPDKKAKQRIINLVRHPREELSDSAYLLHKLGQFWLYGQEIDWTGFYSQEKRHRLSLPTYPFERKRFHLNRGLSPIKAEPIVQRMPIADWFYIPTWIPSQLEGDEKSDIRQGTRWLVFMDAVGLGDQLVNSIKNKREKLEETPGSIDVIVVRCGSRFTKVSDREYIIHPGKGADYDALFIDLKQSHGIPTSIVHLWNVTGVKGEDLTDEEEWLEDIQQSGFYSLTEIARGIGSQGITGKLRLNVVTDNMQRVTGKEVLCPAKALILGPVRVIPREYTNITCRSIDIVLPPPGSPGAENLVEQLLLEFESESAESTVAYRDCQRWEQIYEPKRLVQSQEYRCWLREKGVYLITGGFGGMGLYFALHLVRTVGARLVMIGRSDFPGRKKWKKWLRDHDKDHPVSMNIQRMQYLERLGGKVLVFSADVSNRQRMKEVIGQVKKKFGPINGVFHTAGMADYEGVIQRRTREMSAEILAPKVKGTVVVDDLVKGNQLDFFVVCSSISSIVGPFGEVGYCAANAFLDAFAHYKASRGRPLTVAINWDSWQEVGMAAAAVKRAAEARHKSDGEDALKKFGILIEEGIEVVNRVLEHSFSQVIVSTTDLTAKLHQGSPLAESVPRPAKALGLSRETVPAGEVSRPPDEVIYERPELTTTYAPPDSDTEKILARLWQEHLGIEKVGIYDNFFELGANSMDILQINNKLNKVFKRDIPLVALYTHANINNLKTYLDGEGIEVDFPVPGGQEQERQQVTPEVRQERIEVEQGSDKTRAKEVAVIGMAGRFPGARSVEEFWENLKNGVESIAFFSDEELKEAGIDARILENLNYVKARGVIEDIEYFDAGFFGYSPTEAQMLDPQVRVFMECAWHALEDAGYDPAGYNGLIGLYAGAADNTAWQISVSLSDASGPSEALSAGNFANKDFLSTRISYRLNLNGPSSTVFNACSTSLVALHMAYQSLLGGDCHMAVTGGVAITLPEKTGYEYQEQMIFAPDGHVRAFDEGANGTVFGNGAAAVVLKPLHRATADRDNIYAVIKGIGINNDGNRKVGFVAPSPEGQAEAIRKALGMADVDAESIEYIEAHGTGTSVGDPIEIEALKQAFNTNKKNYCRIGTAKTNVGHLDAAAGVTGLIKAALVLKHRLIPPNLHYKNQNPRIDFKNTPFYVNSKLTEWNTNHYPLRAGVSSFGIGGTNVHVILEEAPIAQSAERQAQSAGREYQLILLSAKTETALENATLNLANHLKKNPGINLADIAYTLMTGRRSFNKRRMLVCFHINEAIEALENRAPGSMQTASALGGNKHVVFMFSGQGAQYVNMGWDIYQEEPAFRADVHRCFDILKSIFGYDVTSILYPSKGAAAENPGYEAESLPHEGCNIDEMIYSGPIKFIIDYSLARLLMRWGIHPYAMIGHSFGEYVAACLSGVFSLEDALRAVVLRGQLIDKTSRGAMMSVPLAEEELKPLLKLNDQLSLAAVNTPSLCIVSGSQGAVDTLEKEINEKGFECVHLNLSNAGHSSTMDPILEEFKEYISRLKINKPRIPYISNVTGQWITAEEAVDPAYYAAHMRQTVRFADGITELLKNPDTVFIQVGPGRGLTLFVEQHPEKHTGQLVIHLLRHQQEKISDTRYLLSRIGQLWLSGVTVDWAAFYANERQYRLSLPLYPFDRKRYWKYMDYYLNRKTGERLEKNKDIADWFFLPSWEPTTWPTHLQIKEIPSQTCALVFMDELGLGEKLVKRLEQENLEMIRIMPGPEFVKLNDCEFIINPSQDHDYNILFSELQKLKKVPVSVLHLWGVTDAKEENHQWEPSLVKKTQDLGFYSLVNLAQAIGKLDYSGRFAIGVVTNNMQELNGYGYGEGIRFPAKATVLGPVRVIPIEFPNIHCFSIDIVVPEPGSRQETRLMNRLISEFTTGPSTSVIAYRGNYRLKQTFTSVKLNQAGEFLSRLKENGVYLIIGGLGGVGLVLAEYLARTVSARLILVGRSAFPIREDWEKWLSYNNEDDDTSRKIRKIRELEASGACVLVLSADVSHPGQVQELVARSERQLGSINGVILSAVEIDGAVIARRTRQMTERVFAPKITGAITLERIFKNKGLDFFVLCSSTASFLGAPGEVAYCAANAFQDAFARYKTHQDDDMDTLYVSINWDAWQEVGQAVRSAEQLSKANILDGRASIEHGILPEEGKQAFARIIDVELPQIVVSTRNMNTLSMLQYTAAAEESASFVDIEDDVDKIEETPQQRPALSTEYVAPVNEHEEILVKIWQNFFGIEPVGTDDNFFELGGDSLKAMIVSTLINKKMNLKVSVSRIFTSPTIKGLAQYFAADAGDEQEYKYFAIEPVEKKEYYVLSSAQKRLYFLQQMDLNITSYNMPLVFPLGRDIKTDKLEITLKKLIARHESLRTSFEQVKELPVQKIHPPDHLDFSMDFYEADEIEAKEIVKNYIRPFDLARAPLLRSGVIHLHTPPLTGHSSQEGNAGDNYIWIVDMHHIISDGTSQTILTEDFLALYSGVELEPLSVQYKGFSQWQNRLFASDEIKSQENYWLELYADTGAIPRLDLPTDFKRPEVFTFEGEEYGFMLEREDAGQFRHLASGNNGTLFMNLLAALDTLFYKYTGQTDIIIGCSIAGRSHADLQQIVGMFINKLAMRSYPEGEKSYQSFLKEVITQCMNDFANQDVQFEELVDKLGMQRELSRNPFFDISIVLQNFRKAGEGEVKGENTGQVEQLPLPDENLPVIGYKNLTAKFDMTFMIFEKGEDVVITIEYYTAIFKQDTIRRLAAHFNNLIKAVVKEPFIKLKDIEIISRDEKQQVLYEFNDTANPYPQDKSLYQLFEEQAARTPDNIAAVGIGTKNRLIASLSYRALNRRVHQLAYYLHLEKQTRFDEPVGIVMHPSIDLVVAILGILTAGSAYVPMTPDLPGERLKQIIKDARIKVVISQETYIRLLNPLQEECQSFHTFISIDNTNIFPQEEEVLLSSPLPPSAKAHNLAYVLYTSGTTGKPKGVLINNRNLVNYTSWFTKFAHITAEDRGILTSSFTFDFIYTAFFSTLLNGAQLHMIGRETYLPGQEFLMYIRKHWITFIKVTPSLFSIIVNCPIFSQEMCSSLRFIMLGGEAINVEDVQKARRVCPSLPFINHYGPTETTIGSSALFIDFEKFREYKQRPTIGKPIHNMRVYMLDKDLQLVPPGILGELAIAGDGVGVGYLNQPELTHDKFICAELKVHSAERLMQRLEHKVQSIEQNKERHALYAVRQASIYLTGDLGRWLEDGNIEFLGRIDQQVKIRGYRIELEEIENQLLKHEKVKEAVVIDRQMENGDQSICAYIVSHNERTRQLEPEELKKYLSLSLPEYMIPTYFVLLDKIPLTIHGKLDRKGLPEPEIIAGDRDNYVPPHDEIEKQLVEIWSQVLGIEKKKLSIDANFFNLGGHSLRATILRSKIHKELDVKFPLVEIFKQPFIRSQAAYIKSAAKDKYTSIEPVEKKEYYALSSAQKRLYFLQQLDLNSPTYNQPRFFPLGKDMEITKLELSLKKLIARHESLRTSITRVEDESVQRVHHHVEFQLEYYDMKKVEVKVEEEQSQVLEGTTGLAPLSIESAVGSSQLAANTIENFVRPFDLGRAPLLRSGVIRLPDGNHTWMVDTHHIISDGTSHMILTEDFMALYRDMELEELKVQYKDFTQWQNRLFASDEIKGQRDYWLSLYADAKEIPRLNLPADFQRPEVFTFAGDYYSIRLEREESLQFNALGSRNGATLFMNMLTVLYTLFYKYTGQTDIIIGSGVAGRPHADLQQIVGMFVNTLVIRNYPSGEKTYETFLKEVVDSSIKAFDNQDVQFEELVDQLEVERDPSRNPLFDISMVVQNFRKVGERTIKREAPARGQVEEVPLPERNSHAPVLEYKYLTAKFDITFFVFEMGEHVFINLEYYTGIFKQETIRRIVSHLGNVIQTVIKEPAILLEDIEIISSEEKQEILDIFNDTDRDYPREKTIHQLFNRQVQKYPHCLALVYQEEALTYKELEARANWLACYLYRKKEVYPGSEEAVGILMFPSLHRPISILGILKVGGVYVPLDPQLPDQRIRFMIEDAGIGTVISGKRHVNLLNRLQWECECFHSYLCVDSENIHAEEEEKNQLMDKELWHHVAENATDDITGGGWVSSYTGEPLSRKEMDEYGDNILKKLLPLLHPGMRVLEIGCASGISMYRIAPKVGFYYGTDLSKVIIEKNKEQVEKQGLKNIKLDCLPAHEIHRLKQKEKKFHLIIINSVIQCFNGHNYLRNVLHQSIDLLTDNGYLFIGDIMDLEKKKALVRELVDFKYTDNNRKKGYTTKTDFSSELFLSRDYWKDLEAEIEEIRSIELSDKIYTIENELTKFRYDALISINKQSGFPGKRQRRKHQEDMRHISAFGFGKLRFPGNISPGNLAYIIYTSGTTGKPKGVLLGHRGIVNLNRVFAGELKITKRDKIIQFANISFDASIWEMFMALLNGAVLHLLPQETIDDYDCFHDYLDRHRITTATLPPIYANHLNIEQFSNLRLLITAGSSPGIDFVKRCRRRENLEYINAYGPTEDTICSSYWNFNQDKDLNRITIGGPLTNKKYYIINNNMFLQPIGVPGELCVSGVGLARGYLNQPELTAKRFIRAVISHSSLVTGSSKSSPNDQCPMTNDSSPKRSTNDQCPMTNDSSTKLYLTGDLARWLANGTVEFLGRVDQQVKLRGFRIEMEEIENLLLAHHDIKNAALVERTDTGSNNYLCAYIVNKAVFSPGQQSKIDTGELRDYLSRSLPDYMIPSYFVQLEKLPLTTSGKLDRKALPAPGLIPGKDYVAPGNDIERKLVEIWSEMLNIDKRKISIESNFFELGGHSLRATILTSKIHKELSVKVPLAEIFKTPTIRKLAKYIWESAADKYTSIEAMEKKEYYLLSSAQKRLYFLHQMDLNSTSYNMPLIFPLGRDIEINKLELTLKKLIARHESLRTSFEQIKELPVQKIHPPDSLDFSMVYYDMEEVEVKVEEEPSSSLEGTRGLAPLAGGTAALNPQPAAALINSFIRPFDLGLAPLVRSGVIKLPGNHHTWMVDMHHIISDGTSHVILTEDFMALYNQSELEPLRLQYKDFSQWQNRLFSGGKIKAQEDYWLSLYADQREIPRLDLPTDFKRPEVFTFEGDRFTFMLDRDDAFKFKALGARYNATLFMSILAVVDILFYKYTGQTDIIIGIAIAGRPHAELQQIVGMFVNKLAMRNYPKAGTTYESFLKEVMEHSLKAFENQDVQFEELVDKLTLERDIARNPLFDISMVVQNFRKAGDDRSKGENQGQVEQLPLPDENLPEIEYRNLTAKFDITFFIHEQAGDVYIGIEYYKGLFKQDTILRLTSHFKNIVKAVVKEPSIRLQDIEFITENEKHRVLYEFNNTSKVYPKDKILHQLFEEQAAKNLDNIAVVGPLQIKYRTYMTYISYRELDRKANQLAHYLYQEKQVRPDDCVGIIMHPSIHLVVAILGILKAGGAYVPIGPSLPGERIKTIIDDAGIGTVLSQKENIRLLNRLQWECESFHTFLCMDSTDIYMEEEVEKNELMNETLWEYVAMKAEDDISGGGWNSSYTGEPLSRKEMDEYGDNILIKLEPILHQNMRVLEIGCASGITMYRIAPRVGFYYGTDLSEVIIEKNKDRIKQEGYENISLSCLAAHQLDQLDEANFDLIIMNSVIQNFHGHNYLGQVLRRCVNLLGSQGVIFIGDIMDQDLKDEMIRELQEFKEANQDKDYRTTTDYSSHLFVSRAFWEDLPWEIAEIKGVNFSEKIHTIQNELTKFRYDTLITVDKNTAARPGHWHRKRHKYQEDSRYLEFAGNRMLTPWISCPARAHHLAYVLYTSGSTGIPKGVMVEHQNVHNLLVGLRQEIYHAYDVPLKICMVSPYMFDASVKQIFAALLQGHGLYMLPEDIRVDGEELLAFYRKYGIDVSDCTPSHLQLMLANCEETPLDHPVRHFLIGGEELSVTIANAFLDQCAAENSPPVISNVYGPTECSVDSTHYRYSSGDPASAKTIPIGKPLANQQVYILDDQLKLQPIGVPGELCIGGDNVSRGYLNRPKLTHEKFYHRRTRSAGTLLGRETIFGKNRPPINRTRLPAPTPQKLLIYNNNNKVPGKQIYMSYRSHMSYIYKTGDRARWIPDGNIEFLGRIDQQVKIRGFRIELPEIQNRLLTHEEIKEAVVIHREKEDGDKYICAYIISNSERSWDAEELMELKAYLSRSLPEYMIPSYFIPLEKIPLTPNGKLDRKGLPTPGLIPGDDFAAPGDRIERKLVEIWSEVLGIEKEKISIDANFFDLGGHSIKATVLTAKIHNQLNAKIPLAEIFKTSTIRGLSKYIKEAGQDDFAAIEPIETKEYYEPAHAQKALWVLNRIEKSQIAYNQPRYYEFEELNREVFEKALNTLIKRHEILRTRFITVNGEPMQTIQPMASFEIKVNYIDLRTGENLEPQQQKIRKIADEEATIPFNLEKGPLLRFKLIHQKDNQYVLLFTMHHIISDGWSMNVLINEMQILYHAYHQGKDNSLSPLRIQNKDITAHHNRQLTGQMLERHRDYWVQRFKGDIPVLKLKTDSPRPRIKTSHGSLVQLQLDKKTSDLLKKFCRKHDVSLVMMLVAALKTLFYRYTGQEDIVIGLPVAQREHIELHNQIGFYINSLPLRTIFSRQETFAALLTRVKQTTLDALQHQVYPFDRLVEDLKTERDLSRSPLFDVVVQLLNFEGVGAPVKQDKRENHKTSTETEAGNSDYTSDMEMEMCKFDLTFNFHESVNGLMAWLIYNRDLFKKERMVILVEKLKLLLQGILSNPEQRLDDFAIELEFEKNIKKTDDSLDFDFET